MGNRSRCLPTPAGPIVGPPAAPAAASHEKETVMTMTRFIIEREIEGAGNLTPAELATIAQTSNEAVASLGVPYTWVNSFVAGDKIYCVHEAEDAETILEHARRGGFPADLVTVVAHEFGPHAAEQVA
jgi:hypothetical protein